MSDHNSPGMGQLAAILWTKRRIARNQLASIRTESKLKIFVVSFSAVALWGGALLVFIEGFQWLQAFLPLSSPDEPNVSDLLMMRLLGTFTLALFVMLIFSNILVSYSTIYKAREVSYLLQAPLPIPVFFLTRLIECVIFSSWASAFLGSPLILAYGYVSGAPLPFYLSALLFYIPFVIIPAAIGAAITLIVLRIFPRSPKGSLTAATLLGLVGVYLFGKYLLRSATLTDERLLRTFLDATARQNSPLLPSYWASTGILSAKVGDYGTTFFYFGVLLANAAMVTLLVTSLASILFYPGWAELRGGTSNKARPLNRGILGRLDHLPLPFKRPIRALIVKDIRLFWRDPVQWGQFVIFFGIMGLYAASLHNHTFSAQDKFRPAIASLNIGACALILSTLTSRFIFPLVSLEGRRFWILGLAPIGLAQIVWQKFWLSIITTSPFTVLLVILTCIALKIEPIPFALSVYGMLLANIALAGLAVGTGTLYPNFEEDNPARIVSGMGGTLNFLLSIGYIAGFICLLFLIMSTEQHYALCTGALSLYSALFLVAPMYLGLRNLQRMEF